MKYLAEIEHRISGIPCLIGVVQYESTAGSFSYNAASDLDYYGYTECDWDVLDRRGRQAPWLARKVGAKETSAIEQKIHDYMED